MGLGRTVGRGSSDRGGGAERAGGLSRGRAGAGLAFGLSPPRLVLGRAVPPPALGGILWGAAWGRGEVEGWLEGREGTPRAEGGAVDRGGSRPVDGRDGAAWGARGSACGRVIGARGLVRVGAAVVPFGSDGAGDVPRAAGGVRTGSRALGRRWRVGRDREVSGACWGAAPERVRSCGLASCASDRRGEGAAVLGVGAVAVPDTFDALRATAVRGVAATGDSLYAASRWATVRARTTGATASPRARRVTS